MALLSLASIPLRKNSSKVRPHSGFCSTLGSYSSTGPEPISYSISMLLFLKATEIRSQFQIVALIGMLALKPLRVNTWYASVKVPSESVHCGCSTITLRAS